MFANEAAEPRGEAGEAAEHRAIHENIGEKFSTSV